MSSSAAVLARTYLWPAGVPVLPVDGRKIPLEVYSADEDTAIIAAKDGASLSAGMRYGD